MPSYLVESYLPSARFEAAREAARRARLAAEQLAREGTAIAYLRMTFLPEDETCFYLFEADSSDVVEEVVRRAELGRFRVLVAVVEDEADVPAPGASTVGCASQARQ